MNIFNKILIVLLLISIVFISFVAIINGFVGYFKWSDVALRLLAPLNSINPYILALALLLVMGISIFILILEFYRRKQRVANISTSKSGNTMITLETIITQIKTSSKKINGLRDLKVKIIPKINGIILNMQAKLDEGSDLPKKIQEIINNASKLVSEKLGIRVLKANLTIMDLASGKAKEEEEPGKEEEIMEEPGPGKKKPDTDKKKPVTVKEKPAIVKKVSGANKKK